MSKVLVDTSIWIDYFRGNPVAAPVSDLIDTGQLMVNDLILAELIPSILKRDEKELHGLLLSIEKVELEIDWEEIIEFQIQNLKAGNNHIGIPDLVIAQNSIQNDLVIFENDKHFHQMPESIGLRLLRKEDV